MGQPVAHTVHTEQTHRESKEVGPVERLTRPPKWLKSVPLNGTVESPVERDQNGEIGPVERDKIHHEFCPVERDHSGYLLVDLVPYHTIGILNSVPHISY